jgi:phage terminase large subunit-like protein
MMAINVTLPPLHAAQREVALHPARFKVLACGRRFGKSYLGEALCYKVGLEGGRAWWVAPSYKLGAVGWRGIRLLAQQFPGARVRIVDRQVEFPTGGSVQVRSADDPQSLRSEGLNFVVLDECAYMKAEAWREALRPALSDRKGGALFISTPHGLNWFRELWLRGQDPDYPDWQSWRFSTYDNPYIDPDEIEAAKRTMLHRIFRQEYEADFLTDNPSALWKREWIDSTRLTEAPRLERLVVGVDPSGSKSGDAQGVIAAGRHGDAIYVLGDATLHGTPNEWASAVVTLYHKAKADLVVAEANYGGDMVASTIATIDGRVPVKLVHASRGKAVRADPVAALYEQGRAHHVGAFDALEDELCQWEPGNASPNRLDALVWAATELLLDSGELKEVTRLW